MNNYPLDRRQLLWRSCAFAASSLWTGVAHADAAFSFAQGEFQITVLSDGFISIPGDIMVPDVTPQERAAILARLDASSGNVRAKCNIPLIRKGKDLILVDIGSGRKYQPSDGLLAQRLTAAGFDPAAITKVIFTHAHPDHIWATLADDDGLRYPNATYYVGASEWSFWMDPDYLTAMPNALHEFARAAQRDLGAIQERVTMLKAGDDVVTGLRALDTPGHTPGHLSFELSGQDGLLITADVATNEIVSFENPNRKFGYDTLPERATATRRQFLDRAATDKIKLLGFHWAYPGIGYAERTNGAYRFVSAP
jgi:glyoxylase-like metal-dependent hydrolase (beta-lactamase superfamily II)